MPHAATCDAAWNSDMGEFSEPRHDDTSPTCDDDPHRPGAASCLRCFVAREPSGRAPQGDPSAAPRTLLSCIHAYMHVHIHHCCHLLHASRQLIRSWHHCLQT